MKAETLSELDLPDKVRGRPAAIGGVALPGGEPEAQPVVGRDAHAHHTEGAKTSSAIVAPKLKLHQGRSCESSETVGPGPKK